MDNFYRTLIPTTLWLGVAAFVLAVFLVVFRIRFPLCLPPGELSGGLRRCC